MFLYFILYVTWVQKCKGYTHIESNFENLSISIYMDILKLIYSKSIINWIT